jgi:hypothetical protein
VFTLRSSMSVSPRLLKLPKPHGHPIHADGAEQGGARDVVVADVIDFEAAGVEVAQ